jgi:hypothetical protein
MKNMKISPLMISRFTVGLIYFMVVPLSGMETGIPKGKFMAYEPQQMFMKPLEYRYFFHQQINDMCMIAPMLNLKILELMDNGDGTYDLNKVSNYSRREWMALNIPYLLKWHGIIENLNHPLGKKQYPGLVQLIESAKRYGPVFPHFYDENGDSLLSTDMRDAVAETLQAPYLLIDYAAIHRFKFTIFGVPVISMGDLSPALGLYLPIFKQKNKSNFEIAAVTGEYPHQKVAFDSCGNLSQKIDLSQFSSPQYLGMNALSNLSVVNVNFLGLDKILKTTGIGRGYLSDEIMKNKQLSREHTFEVGEDIIQSTQSEFLTFSIGLYKLMLVTLGITDRPISYVDTFANFEEEYRVRMQEEKLTTITSDAAKELYSYIEQDPSNPWHPTYFSKENFLQHAIAQILKDDPVLYEEAKVVNDFYFRLWGTYNKYLGLMADGDCFNYLHERYYISLAKYFLPSEEYAMAYSLTQNAWLLSIGAINSSAFYKALTNGTGSFRGLLIGAIWSYFKDGAYSQKNIPETDKILSYMDIWKKITKKLTEKYGPKNWISFSGHGMIISFNNDLINKQKAQKNEDPILLDDLGFAIIDSWLGSELNTFYKTYEVVSQEG